MAELALMAAVPALVGGVGTAAMGGNLEDSLRNAAIGGALGGVTGGLSGGLDGLFASGAEAAVPSALETTAGGNLFNGAAMGQGLGSTTGLESAGMNALNPFASGAGSGFGTAVSNAVSPAAASSMMPNMAIGVNPSAMGMAKAAGGNLMAANSLGNAIQPQQQAPQPGHAVMPNYQLQNMGGINYAGGG